MAATLLFKCIFNACSEMDSAITCVFKSLIHNIPHLIMDVTLPLVGFIYSGKEFLSKITGTQCITHRKTNKTDNVLFESSFLTLGNKNNTHLKNRLLTCRNNLKYIHCKSLYICSNHFSTEKLKFNQIL